MSTFGDELIQSLSEALAHAKEDGPAIVHPSDPTRDSQESEAKADTDGTADVHESFWHPEMGTRWVSGRAATLLHVIDMEHKAVQCTLPSAERV